MLIEAEGEPSSLERFLEKLRENAPPLARIDELQCVRLAPLGECSFRIEPSDGETASDVFIAPDAATCADCLAELFDPADRRYRYPFLNCTHCGPRLTIIEGAPYDRQRTTMAPFQMCPECLAEYHDPANRRFHAQPTACPVCGPRLAALAPDGEPMAGDDPLGIFVEALLHGAIGALKGLGGFHLVCDAGNDKAVDTLRRRKHRDEKPFAIMVSDADAAGRLCHLELAERELLESPRRPIVLLAKRDEPLAASACVADAVAPGNPSLGVMLPYTPLHHLLVDAVGGRPLVMTSGNRSDEPIAYANDEAVERLGDIADLLLVHDRAIHVRCDDSVTRVVAGRELVVRRSRGYAPEPIRLPVACPTPALAVGGQLKGTFALGRERQAFLSHHLGDLDHLSAYQAFERDVQLYEELFEVRPSLIVHDQHPDYASTRYAQARAAAEGLELLAVQHHHAHMASCMAENGLDEPVIGVSFDGTGFGSDSAIWGGEILIGDYADFARAAHLRYVPMPGGERAIREPWRMAVAHLLDSGCDPRLVAGVAAQQLRTVERMIEREFNAPATSSAGRLFDAVAALAGVRTRVRYEGQAAMELEWLATGMPEDGAYPFEAADVIDTRPLVCAVAEDVRRGTGAARIARRFHSTMVDVVATACRRVREQTGIDAVVLSGGVFMNALLARESEARLAELGFRVYRQQRVPPNDGGLSLGQLAVAAKTAGQGSTLAKTANTTSNGET